MIACSGIGSKKIDTGDARRQEIVDHKHNEEASKVDDAITYQEIPVLASLKSRNWLPDSRCPMLDP